MSSLSNTQYNSRTMNGLVNVNANTGTFTDLEVNNLVINQSGTAPTMPSNDNSTNIATTAFVQSHTSGAYVTLTTNQTISGEKTFSNANTYVTGNLVTNSIQSDNPINNINIGTQLTTGDINMGTSALAGQGVALNWGSSTNTGQLSLHGGSFTLNSTGNYAQSSGNTLTTTIDGTKTTGITNICTGASFAGTLNIASGIGATTGSVNISTGTTANAPIRIGSTSSSTQLLTLRGADLRLNKDFTSTANTIEIGSGNSWSTTNINSLLNVYGYTIFDDNVLNNFTVTNNDICYFNNGAEFSNICPTSLVAPTTGNHLCNKTYVDTTISTGYVTTNTTQTITGAKTFNNFAINQTTGNVDTTLNSNSQKQRLIRGTNTFDTYFTGGTAYSVVMASTSATSNLSIFAGSGASLGGITIQPSGGLGVGPEIDFQATSFFTGPIWVDGTNSGLKCFGTADIKLYNSFAPQYLPSSFTTASIGYQLLLTSTTTPTLGANINITFISTGNNFFTLTAGVWLCEAYSGWAQASNNRAVSISPTSATPDTQRACYSSQQNASFQELTFTTAISLSTTTNYYFIVTSGSNSGTFSNVTHTLRITRIA